AILLLLYLLPRPPTPTLFPYTTLFRSAARALRRHEAARGPGPGARPGRRRAADGRAVRRARRDHPRPPSQGARTDLERDGTHDRSEEHTSELQSRRDLVCRLLLEKKKK